MNFLFYAPALSNRSPSFNQEQWGICNCIAKTIHLFDKEAWQPQCSKIPPQKQQDIPSIKERIVSTARNKTYKKTIRMPLCKNWILWHKTGTHTDRQHPNRYAAQTKEAILKATAMRKQKGGAEYAQRVETEANQDTSSSPLPMLWRGHLNHPGSWPRTRLIHTACL